MRCWGKQSAGWILGTIAAQLATVCLSIAVLFTFKLGGSSLPCTEIAGSFALLAIVHGVPGFLRSANHDQPRRRRWATYMGIALLQSTGLALTLIGLKYSFPASWILMMQLDVVVILPLTASFFKVKYRVWHYAGFACAGLGLIILSIFGGASSEGMEQTSALGNMLVGIGAVMLGIANVWVEGSLRGGARQHDLLTGVGVFGTVFGFTASLIAEEIPTHAIQDRTMDVFFFRAGVAVALFLLHGLTSVSLPFAGAVLQKTSLLTSSLCIQGGFLVIGGGVIFMGGSVVGISIGVSFIVLGGAMYFFAGNPYDSVESEAEEKLPISIADDVDESAAPLL